MYTGQQYVPQGTQNVTVVSEATELCIVKGAAVVPDGIRLLKDNVSQMLYVSCSFRAMTDRPVSAVLVDFVCRDVWGNDCEGIRSYQYLDLNTRRGTVFGANCLVPLPDRNTRSIAAKIQKILYADGQMEECVGEQITIPAPLKLETYFGNADLAQQYRRETNASAQFTPCVYDGGWRCSCGSLNAEQEAVCPLCGGERDRMIPLLQDPCLQENLLHYQQWQREQEEAARKEQERRREVELAQEAERAAAEQRLIRERQRQQERKRKKRNAVLTVVLLLLVLAIGAAAVFVYLPYDKYNKALDARSAGRYDEAYALFVELGDYKDSPSQAQKTRYEKAEALMEEGKYDSAIGLFTALGSYKDSQTQIKECNYRKAIDLYNTENFPAAYDIFNELGTYSDSSGWRSTCLVMWAAKALGSTTSDMASNLAKKVTLTTQDYEAFYSTIQLFITGRTDVAFWFSGSSETMASRNTLYLLNMLPKTYQDTATLAELFSAIQKVTSIGELFDKYESVMRKCWSLGFVKNFASCDAGIGTFLEGYWTGSGYYFEIEEDGTSSFDLPWVSKPSGTKYYDIENMIYHWEDSNNTNLANVFRFEIVDYDTIRVYCYKNSRTYTMYR